MNLTKSYKKISTKYAYARAVKNRLCRIEDYIAKVWSESKMVETDKQKLMVACIEIDKCVESLEKLLKLL